MQVFRHYIIAPAMLLAALDGIVFLLALYALGFTGNCSTCYLSSHTHLNFSFELWEAVLLAAGYVVICIAMGLYNRDALKSAKVFLSRFFLASQMVMIPAVTVIGLNKMATSAAFGWYVGVIFVSMLIFFAVMLAFRVVLLWILDPPFLKRRLIILGDGPEADEVSDVIATHGSSHLLSLERVRNYTNPAPKQAVQGNLAMLFTTSPESAPIVDLANDKRADEIILAVDHLENIPLNQLLDCRLQGIKVSHCADFLERETGKIALDRVSHEWFVLAEGFRLSTSRRLVKRGLDIFVSSLFLSMAVPIGLLVALAIKLDSRGPVFYKQERVGRNGRIFRIWKFRSMRTDAEKDGVARWAGVKDDRITRVGRIIRKFRLDEFPQVLNVLYGDMSFIGPRPERPVFVNQLAKQVPFYNMRHRVEPGITGWAQINYPYGASVEDAKQKLAFDLYYIKNQDIFLDLFTLLQTIKVLILPSGSR